MTQRGSRSTMKQMPPRCCARCSTARRRRRGPLGPTISQSAPFGKRVVGQRVAEALVVDPEVVDVDPRLRHAGAAAGLEDVDRPVGVRLRHPAAHRPAAQPLVLEEAELVEVGVAVDVRAADRSRSRFARSSQNGQPVAGIEMPADDLAHVRRRAARAPSESRYPTWAGILSQSGPRSALRWSVGWDRRWD